jgi:tRNA threonylcarbamoyladenosine biosynthesis protein TsaE
MTKQIAAALAELLTPGDLVALTGPLGVGKTCFAQGIARGLGIRQNVSSPSFVLAKHYPGSPSLLHIDAYRLSSAEEFRELGLEEQLQSSIGVVEWAEKVGEALPDERIEVTIAFGEGDERLLQMAARGGRGAGLVGRLGEKLKSRRERE